ncbi:hypothetical protein EW146_g9107 [Bondarzewia mesenterica]|uniref:mRNA decay factor PAT1 domain-containing protein n=1 Tax=Bondarzewia mesenterica TaxID=1095465 RepID=A0A4S4L8W1_9AGAM|nr:hypothetical protein EW146_g9107 [Bondarzewia mesenterica]
MWGFALRSFWIHAYLYYLVDIKIDLTYVHQEKDAPSLDPQDGGSLCWTIGGDGQYAISKENVVLIGIVFVSKGSIVPILQPTVRVKTDASLECKALNSSSHMSFFGFEQNDLLEREKQDFLERKKGEEDLAVYTWGEESYDGLGDILQEGGDELNDETFGGMGEVGKDFDFTQQTLALDDDHKPTLFPSKELESLGIAQAHHDLEGAAVALSQSSHQAQSLWDEKSPFSVLPRMNGAVRTPVDHARPTSSSRLSQYSNGSIASATQMHAPSPGIPADQPISQGVPQTGVRTLEEIEAEMRAAAQRSRTQAAVTQRQQLLQEQQLQQQQYYQQQQRAAPPRMHPQSQSPRFHQQQQHQQLLLQQQREQQLREQQLREQRLREQQLREQQLREQQLREQQLREQQLHERQLQELQLREQLQMEELERQLRAQRLSDIQRQQQEQQLLQSQYLHQRQSSNQALAELQTAHQLNQRRQRSPALIDPHLQAPHQQSHNIQLQQRLLSELAQAEFMQNMQATSQEEQEALRAEAMRRIMETERMEEKRRRKAAKIAHMVSDLKYPRFRDVTASFAQSRYNDLMTQSDKDFITRIQVSQLVTQDPYAEDFYAQVYSAVIRSRMGLQTDERVLKFGSGGGVGLGVAQKGSSRRPNAMQKMEQQVERIVTNARLREKEKGLHSAHSLQGALGKTSGRSYKAAPRQLLQVDSTNGATSPSMGHAHISKEDAIRQGGEGAAKEAAKMGAEALGGAADPDGTIRKDPLTSRETLFIIEHLYDIILNIEHMRRDEPAADSDNLEEVGIWNAQYNELVQQLFDELRVMEPLETSNPHPFISLLTPSKGKRLLPRTSRLFNDQQMMTLVTLLVACFSQLDVIIHSALLDTPISSQEQTDIDKQTQTFVGSVVQSILPTVAKAELRLISGWLGLLFERSDILAISQTRPGIAFLTMFLSRVEVIKQSIATQSDPSALPTQEEVQQWQLIFDHLFQILHPNLLYLFPSTRLAVTLASLPPIDSMPPVQTDALDQPVWQFLAALAEQSSNEQQQALVTALREKVLENVASANKGWITDEDERQAKIGNVNLFLHSLGLDSSQISV